MIDIAAAGDEFMHEILLYFLLYIQNVPIISGAGQLFIWAECNTFLSLIVIMIFTTCNGYYILLLINKLFQLSLGDCDT